jgi:microcystin-dependent protein
MVSYINAAVRHMYGYRLRQTLLLTAAKITPSGYVPADGSLFMISDNTALFNLLGTTFGGGGVTRFALPDLRTVAPNNTLYLICVSGYYP